MSSDEDIRLRRRTVARVGKRPVAIHEDATTDSDLLAGIDALDIELNRFERYLTRANVQAAENPPRTSSLPTHGGGISSTPENAESPGRNLSLPRRPRPAVPRGAAEASPVVAGPSTQRPQTAKASQVGAAPTTLLKDIEEHHAKMKKQIVEIIKRSNELDKLVTRPHVQKTLAPKALSADAQVFETPALLRQQTEDIQDIWGIYAALAETFGEAARDAEAFKDTLDSI